MENSQKRTERKLFWRWSWQLFPRYNVKSTDNNNEKIDKLNYIELKRIHTEKKTVNLWNDSSISVNPISDERLISLAYFYFSLMLMIIFVIY